MLESVQTRTVGHDPRLHVLLVDDDEKNLIALEAILQSEDRALIRASSGFEACMS